MTTLPTFSQHESHTGEVALKWPPFEAANAWVLVLLRDPDPLLATDFWAGAYDNDLIRVPVSSMAGQASVFAPTGRAVWLALAARDADGARLPAPAIGLRHPPKAAPVAVTPLPRLEQPVRHQHPPDDAGAAIPFVFAATDAAPPSLDRLAKRVATQMGAGKAAAARTPASGFGTKQKWYLTRLRFAGTDDPGRPRVAVRRQTFIDDTLLTAWATRPPTDATMLAPGCDGLIDAVADMDETVFYVVLDRLPGTLDWRPIPLSPLAPPFVGVSAPHVWGDATIRLEAVVTARLDTLSPTESSVALDLTDLPPALDLIRASVAFLSPAAALRTQTEARCKAIAQGSKF
ncbi:MAG: hypothetical protein ACI9MR_002039 [Myxococcota bacterium]|jgi:hypothetical protein